MARLRLSHNFLVLPFAVLLTACAGTRELAPPPTISTAPARTEFRSSDFFVVIAQRGDTAKSLARRHLGDERRAWEIEDFNHQSTFVPGFEVVIPLQTLNPTGVHHNGYQTVPILCYHRFGPDKSKMVVAPDDFENQLAYLAENNFRVVRMSDVREFLLGKKALPRRAVVLTIDDGYRSVYQYAFPLLKKYNMHATVFLYSDFVGARDALSWKEMQEMVNSGIVDIQPHSKTHSNLGIAQPDEDEKAYAQRIAAEVSAPQQEIVRNLNVPVHTFAYPYGDTNKFVIDKLKQRDYQLGVTVQAGANAAFAFPYMLQRTMVFGDHDMPTFRKMLDVFAEFGAP